MKPLNSSHSSAKTDRAASGPRTVFRIAIERYPIAGRFTIARGAKTEAVVVTVNLQRNSFIGCGECVPYGRYGETPEGVAQTLESVRNSVEQGLTREALQKLMPAGAARNALDCALWDLEAKINDTPVHHQLHLALTPVTTAYTISLGTPEEMAEATRKAAHRTLLKIKLGGTGGDIERIRAVRAAAPNSTLIADANEGWTPENLVPHLRECHAARFALIEQPLPAKADDALANVERLVPLCADESVHDRASLARLKGLYDSINIKLDKTGGLTEALALADAAQSQGFGLMIGCMVGTSLAMAPALMLAPRASFIDLDGPLLLAQDRPNGLVYEQSLVHPPEPRLWG